MILEGKTSKQNKSKFGRLLFNRSTISVTPTQKKGKTIAFSLPLFKILLPPPAAMPITSGV